MIMQFRKSKDEECEVILKEKKLPGVSWEVFEELYNSMQNSPDLRAEGERHVVDTFYPNNIRGRHVVGNATVYVKKTPVVRRDEGDQENGLWLRFALKREEKMPRNFVPEEPPVFFRLQNTQTFLYKEGWMYTLSKVVQGMSKEEACRQDPTFEVELEILHNGPAVRTCVDDEKLAASFAAKAKDLLGTYK
jgi:hypothetical protein